MGTQIISVDAHEVEADDLIVGRMSAGPVAKVAHHEGTWFYMGHDGLTIATSLLGGRVQVARESRNLLDASDEAWQA